MPSATKKEKKKVGQSGHEKEEKKEKKEEPKKRVFVSKVKTTNATQTKIRKNTMKGNPVISAPRVSLVVKRGIKSTVDSYGKGVQNKFKETKTFKNKAGVSKTRTTYKIGKTEGARRLLSRILEREGVEVMEVANLMVSGAGVNIMKANTKLALERRKNRFHVHEPSVPENVLKFMKVF